MNKKNVCLTTFIWGTKYQSYIPFLIYSCNKAYPEYDIHLFLYDKLDSKIKAQIETIKLNCNLRIDENVFNDCKKMNVLKAKSLRWVLWSKSFLNYDYLYTVDIDMLYIREPLSLHEQHVIHMDYTGLPISNIARQFNYKPIQFVKLAKRLKHAGLKSIFKYLQFSRTEYKLTGLHFVDVKRYYGILTPEKIKNFKLDIYSGNYLKYTLWPNCEVFLYNMFKKLEFKVEKLGTQKNQEKMLEFDNPNRDEFRPHHGIHLGIFRRPDKFTENDFTILNSPTYKYYIKSYKENIFKDEVFINLLKNAPLNISDTFKELHKYYKLNI